MSIENSARSEAIIRPLKSNGKELHPAGCIAQREQESLALFKGIREILKIR